jgi:hypothetical protein
MKILPTSAIVIASVLTSLTVSANEQVVSVTTSTANDVPEIVVTYKREPKDSDLESAYASAEAVDLIKGEVLAELSLRLKPQDS